MADNSISDRDRFREARERYQAANEARAARSERMDGDGTSEDQKRDDNRTLLDFIKFNRAQPEVGLKTKQKEQKMVVPLPVIPVDKKPVVEQMKTNSNLEEINKAIRTHLPKPLKIDDSRISRESTLRQVNENIAAIRDMLPKTLKHFEEHTDKILGTRQNAEVMVEAEEKKTGWVVKTIEKFSAYMKGFKPVTSIAETIVKAFKPMTNYSKKMYDVLAKMHKLNLQMFIMNNLTKFREKSATVNARAAIDAQQFESEYGLPGDDGPVGPLKGIMRFMFPDGTKMRKAIDFTKNTANMFLELGMIGQNFTLSKFQNASSNSWIKNLARMVPAITQFLGTTRAIATFFASVGAVLAIAPIYAAFKNPDQLAGYLEAFGRIISENLIPTFKWIVKEIGPALAVLAGAFAYVADLVLDTVGTIMNKGMIVILRDALPELLTTIGHTVDAIWQGLKGFVMRFAGIFGVGEHANKGVLENLFMAFVSIADGIMEAISEWQTKFIGLFINLDVFGLRDGETIYGRIKRFFAEEFLGLVNKVATNIVEYLQSLDLGETIREKVGKLFTAIADFIPSWDDIKQYLKSILPDWLPDTMKNWMNSQLDSPTNKTPWENANHDASELVQRYKEAAPVNIHGDKQEEDDSWSLKKTFKNIMSPFIKEQPKLPPPPPQGFRSIMRKPVEQSSQLPLSPWERMAATQSSPIVVAPQTNNNSNSTTVINNGGGNRGSMPIGSTRPERNDPLQHWLLKGIPY